MNLKPNCSNYLLLCGLLYGYEFSFPKINNMKKKYEKKQENIENGFVL